MAVVGKTTCRVAGHRQLIKAGRLYDDSDPIVKDRPDLFESPEDYQRRKARPQSTAELGHRSMSARHLVESARSAPGEERIVDFPCPTKEETGCAEAFSSVRAAKIHAKKAHG